MKLLRTPLLLMAAAAGLAGVVYVIEFHRPPTSSQTTVSPTTATSPARLFEFQEREIQGLSIKTGEMTVVLE